LYETRSKVERGFSASPTVRHSRITAELQPAQHDWPHGPALTTHLQRHLGKTETVWHEIVSEFLHIDVHAYEPSPHWPAVVLVTEGMSRLPMMVPRELHPRWRWAELVLCLSRDWPLGQTDIKDERHFWPLRWLWKLARFPHEYRTWLGYGHTVPNGDPPRPFADNTELCCWLLAPPAIFAKGFSEVALASGETLHLYTPIPIYGSELELKLKQGADALLRRLWDAGALAVLNPTRKPVC
jgi:hypothetical protein